MKLSSFFAIFVFIFVASAAAQRCVGRPRNPTCTDPLNLGRRGRGCIPRTMWYYNQRTRLCEEIRYRGCGGSNNRWCSKAACDQRCAR